MRQTTPTLILLLFAIIFLAGCTAAPGPAGTLSGAIRCSNCSLAGRHVVVENEDTSQVIARPALDATGHYSAALAPGRYMVDVSGTSGAELPFGPGRDTSLWWPQPIMVASGQLATANIDLGKIGVQENATNPIESVSIANGTGGVGIGIGQ